MPDRLDEEREAQIRRRVQHFADTHTLPEDFQRYRYDAWMFLLRRLREESAEAARLREEVEGLNEKLAHQSIDLGDAISRANEAEDEAERLRALPVPTR